MDLIGFAYDTGRRAAWAPRSTVSPTLPKTWVMQPRPRLSRVRENHVLNETDRLFALGRNRWRCKAPLGAEPGLVQHVRTGPDRSDVRTGCACLPAASLLLKAPPR